MSTTQFIEWRERYSVGNGVLDTDHQEIISIINKLFNSLQNQSAQTELRAIFDRLLDYTISHFDREEKLMEKYSFPELEQHQQIHRHLTQKTKELSQRYMHNENNIPQETMTFLKNWWIDHIIVKDMRYKPYLEGVENQTGAETVERIPG